jgi:hypothetical protein
LFLKCSDDPASITGDIPPKISIVLETADSNSDSLSQTSSYFHPKDVRHSPAGRLLVGKINDEINASILIKFQAALPDSIEEDILNDSITVTSAEMVLRRVYNFGDDAAEFDFTVHKVLNNWSIDITEDSTIQTDPADLKTGAITHDDTTTFPLNNDLLKEWLDIIADTSLTNNNYGLHIVPTAGTNKVIGYAAITATLEDVPYIRVGIEKLGGAYRDTIIFASTADLTYMKGNLPQTAGDNIIVRSGYVINSQLRFDLSNLPEDITVNKAELILTADTLQTKIGSNTFNSLQAYFLFDSTNTDSVSASSVRLSRQGTKYIGDIVNQSINFVSQWLHGNNHGLLITSTDPLNGVEIFVLKGSNASEAEKPLLKLTYTKKN